MKTEGKEEEEEARRIPTAGTQSRSIPNYVQYTCRTHGEATATAAAKREDECLVVLLSLVWFPLDNTLFIAPIVQY